MHYEEMTDKCIAETPTAPTQPVESHRCRLLMYVSSTEIPSKANEGVPLPHGTGPMRQPNNQDLQNYQLQLMLLEQQKNKRLGDGIVCATCGGQHFKMRL